MRNVITHGICFTVVGDIIAGHLAPRLDDHLAVLGHIGCLVSAFKIETATVCWHTIDKALVAASFTHLCAVSAIHIADVATAEDVAIALGNAFLTANLAATDMHLGLAEDVAVSVERTRHTQVVVASSTAKDVAKHFTAIHLHVGAARIVYRIQHTYGTALLFLDIAAPHGSNLAAAEETAAHRAAVHKHIGVIDTTVIYIAATEDVAAVLQAVVGHKLVVDIVGLILDVLCIGPISILIPDVPIAEGDVTCAPDGTALAAAVGVALNGRNAVNKARAVLLTDIDIGLTENVIAYRVCYNPFVEAHGSVPASAIDVAAGAALDIDVAAGDEVVAKVILINLVAVDDTAHRTGTVDVLHHRTAEQSDIGGAEHVTAVVVQLHGIVRRLHITQTAAVGVVHHGGTLVNQHVGVELLAFKVGVSAAEVAGFFSQGACKTTVDVIVGIVFGTYGNNSQIVDNTGVKTHQFFHRSLIHHAAHLAAAIDLIDPCTVVQVYLRVFRPSVSALACTIDGGEETFFLVAPHGAVDVHLAVERAAVVVVAAIEGSCHGGILAAVVQRAFIDVARLITVLRSIVSTEGTGKEVLHLDGGASRHIHDGSSRDALREAPAVCRANLTSRQVDDRCCGDAIGIQIGRGFRHAHADAAVLTCAKHLHLFETVTHFILNVHQHIAAVLHSVLFMPVLYIDALAATKDFFYHIRVVVAWLEVDEDTLQPRLFVLKFGKLIAIVIAAIIAAIDTTYDTLHILYIGRGYCQRIVIKRNRKVVAESAGEVTILIFTIRKFIRVRVLTSPDFTTEVIAAIDIVAILCVSHVGNAEVFIIIAVSSHVGLGMSQDISGTRATECPPNKAVAQIHSRIAGHQTLETAAIDEVALRRSQFIFGNVSRSAQINLGAVSLIIYKLARIILLSHDTHFATAKDLRSIAARDVHRRTAPYLGLFTVASSVKAETGLQHVHELVVTVNIGSTVDILINGSLFEVDDHVAVHMAAFVATAVDVAADKASSRILVIISCIRNFRGNSFS